MLRSDIPNVLFSCIKEDDPYRASKRFQIERWCYANWRLHQKSGKKGRNFLAQMLSSEDCWKKVDNLHGVKLDRQVVGKKLIAADSGNLFDKYAIACRYCLEEDIKCAVNFKQEQAVEFFWNKIKSLPESEMGAQKKDEIFMKTAVYAAGSRCHSCLEMFEFCFSQINSDKYPELLKRDLAENGYYGSLNTLQGALRFDQFQGLFDYLKPSNVSEGKYHIWLQHIKTENGSYYAGEGVKLFMHMWPKEGFDSHRACVLKKEVCNRSCFLVTSLLIPWVNQNYMELVWAILDKANSDQIKEFMDSRQAEYIRSVLEKRDVDSLNKFLSYSKSTTEECTSLTEVKLSKACEQLELGN